ncbi:MAG: hypothetical protein K5637_00100 [Lachnospiraceae bacterium]|nr:hypothetical protein [Lachnospiraceae bacterium]
MSERNNSYNTRQTVLSAVMLALGIACIIAGFYIARSTGQRMVFTGLSIPAAILIVSGAWRLIGLIRAASDPLAGAGSSRSGQSTYAGGKVYPAKNEFDAEVLGVTRNIRVEGQKEVYYIVCKYREEETGREFTYTSRPLREYPGRQVIGKKVHVSIDPRDPDNYTVDIDPLLKK